MKLKKLISTTAVALVVTAAAAQAATFSWTEGKRDQVAGTSLVAPTDAADSPPGFDIGTLGGGGGTIDVHGRIVSQIDHYTFHSDRAFKIEWLFGGYTLENPPSEYPKDDNTVSGLIARAPGSSLSPVNIFLESVPGGLPGAAAGNTFLADYDGTEVGDTPTIFGRQAGGTYILKIDGLDQDDALYDIRITAVPLPAGGLLLLTALGGLGIARRRRK